jgi:hemolysin-activating ACP:hemolysin acyltransferase
MFFSSRKGASVGEKSAAVPRINKPLSAPSDTTAETKAASERPNQSALSVQAQRRLAGLRLSAAFTQVVSLLIRSPLHKHMSIADLEWMVFPPLLSGQFRIANIGSKKTGTKLPAAVVLWASVSAEVDKKLSENAAAPLRLRPDEWRSGDIIWLVEAAGDPRVVSKLLTQLNTNLFKNRTVKVRTREAGNPAFGTLQGLVSKTLNS